MAYATALAILQRLAALGSRAAPAMRAGANTERAEKIARAARGTQSMEGANRGFTLVGKPQFGAVTPAGPVTTPPGSAVALRGSTAPATAGGGAGVPAAAGAPSGGALTGQGSLLADPRMQRMLNTTGAAGATGAAVLAESPTSLLDFLPQRAEGDPAGAINRRNAPMADHGMSDAAYRFKDLPGYEGEGAPMYMDKEAYGLPDSGYRQLIDLAKSAGKSDAAYRAERPTPRAAVQAAAAAEPVKRGLLGGPDYQSTGQAVVERMQGPMRSGEERAKPVLNWGNQENAADFFRADQAMREMMKNKEEFEGRASGGKVGAGAGGKDAAIHKALEIIHHLLTRR